MPAAAPSPVASPDLTLILKCVSHPQLGDIRIEDSLFAIGRGEPPFADCEPATVGCLSRRHARIFSEFGTAYIADLGSKNGTTVNGLPVRQKPARLKDGDEIGLGGELAFKLSLATREVERGPALRLLSLTLTPERTDLGLPPVVIAHFPFLVSKTDAVFAAYRQNFPQQANYISRRHAHIFLKNGMPWVEDLGSTNGTFVGDKRLDEHAVALHDDDRLAFGGHHLVFRVSLQTETVSEHTLTRYANVAASAAVTDNEKTTFVAAADSFLDIFCVDPVAVGDDAINAEAGAEADADSKADAAAPTKSPAGTAADRPPRSRSHAQSRAALLATELKGVLAAADRRGVKRVLVGAAAIAVGVVLLALGFFIAGGPQRELQNLIDAGAYADAATAARQAVADHPDDAKLRALGSEALLKAYLPGWLARMKQQDFAGAAELLATMDGLAAGNADAKPLVAELAWVASLEQFVFAQRGKQTGGAEGTGEGHGEKAGEGTIRIYADEERMGALLKQWDDDVQGHQRAFTTISAQVPEFRDWYAEALSHLRKLQSDNSVYLVAIDRLKATVASELARDQPEALKAVLAEYREKYPRLAGLDALEQDLTAYLALDEARAGRLGPLVAAASSRFATPPFEARRRALADAGKLPTADVVARYEKVAQAWRAGDGAGALAELKVFAGGAWGGAWGEAAAREAKHKQAVLDAYAELQKGRGSAGHEGRLLAFYGLLDPADDVHFVRATAADLAAIRDQALKRADEQLARAQSRWRQYRDGGPIESAQRLESEVSTAFRRQAQLLAEADDEARQGARIYEQLKVELPAPLRETRDAVAAEAKLQRSALRELRLVLDPAVLKTKLTLIGGGSDGQRESP